MKKIIGISLIVAGFVFLVITPFSGITGHAISTAGKSVSSVLGLAFVVGGLGFFMVGRKHKMRDKLKQIRRSGSIRSYNELTRIAGKMGYDIEQGKKHREIYNDEGKKITEIPRHTTEKKGTHRSIVDALLEYA